MVRKFLKNIVILSVLFIFASSANSETSKRYTSESISVMIGGAKARVIAKKTLASKISDRYSAKNMFDGDKATAWATKYDTLESEDLMPDNFLLRIIFEEPVYVKALRIRNGYQMSKKIYEANQRVKKMYIEKVIMGGRTYPFSNTVHLGDNMAEQTVSLIDGWSNSINLIKTKELFFDVRDIYEGNKYDDLCISELHIDISNNSGYTPSTKWNNLKKIIDKNKVKTEKGWDWDGINDNNFQLFNDFLFYTLKGNKEAYLYFESFAPEGVMTSESMEYIYKPAVSETLQ